MKIPGWIPKSIQVPSSAKWDGVLLPTLFLFNLFNFSSWLHLVQAPINPWLFLPWLYGLVGLFPLVWRNRAPMAVFVTQWVLAVTWVLAAVSWPFMVEYAPVVGIPVALYAVSFHCSRKASLLALAVSLFPIGITAYAVSFMVPRSTLNAAVVALISNAIFFTVMVIGAWVLGRSIGVSQRHQRRLEYEQKTSREIEVLTEERRKIARELHDIVSHSVTVILLQANGAGCIADTDFTQITDSDFTRIKQSLAHITTTGTQTMTELRRLLEVLETGDSIRDAVGISELEPQPGLANLTTLLASLGVTGMVVTAHVEGTPRDLDPSVDLTAYRIVQEGLTNILKHAGKDANPRLRLVWKSQTLLIQIDNDTNFAEAPRKSALSVGRGLVGLRERVHTVGGNLNAGPRHEGGYRLIATLPFSTPEISLFSSTSGQSHEDQGKISA
jgi:signal transduction histidine kinase